MQIELINDKQIWNDFLISLNHNTFLQSWGWVKFNQRYGNKVWTLGMFETEKLISVAFILKLEAKRGRFLFCPHGPQFLQFQSKYLKEWATYFAKLAKTEKCSFVRISPIQENNDQNIAIFEECGFRRAPIHMHAELSTVLDITGSDQEVKSRIKKNARYDLRRAEEMFKQGLLQIQIGEAIDDEVYEVYRETFVRGEFVPFSQKYLQNELESFKEENGCDLLKIYYENKLISWGMVVYFGKRAFYHQGANILIKGVPAPTLVQWSCIQLARQRGCQSYDFWGVSPKENLKHPWYNISKFKRSFGGQEVSLVPAQDLIINKLTYFPTWLIETIRRKKRGF